jgi:hypothetical protein
MIKKEMKGFGFARGGVVKRPNQNTLDKEGMVEIDAVKNWYIMPKTKPDGLKVYDPRIHDWVESDNPALLFAYFVRDFSRGTLFTRYNQDQISNATFWAVVAKMADYCDAEIDFNTHPDDADKKED